MSAEPIDGDPTTELPVGPPDPAPVARAVSVTRGLCPFLSAGGGAWRSAEAAAEHRCTAVAPPVKLATEKQRRLCLTPSHASCATFLVAREAREPAVQGLGAGARPIPRTTPVVLERGRFAITNRALHPDRTAGQAALVIVLAVAFAGIVTARPGSGTGGPADAIVNPTTNPGATSSARTSSASAHPAVSSAAPAAASPAPQITLVPTENTPPPSGSEPPGATTTYTVQRGDTLSGIAATHGTTWQVLAKLNAIKDPSALKVGTVLQLP